MNRYRKGVEWSDLRSRKERKERGEDIGKRWGGNLPFFTLTFSIFFGLQRISWREGIILLRSTVALCYTTVYSPLPLQPPAGRPVYLLPPNSLVWWNGMSAVNSVAVKADALKDCQLLFLSGFIRTSFYSLFHLCIRFLCFHSPLLIAHTSLGNHKAPWRITWWRPRPVKTSKGTVKKTCLCELHLSSIIFSLLPFW